MPHRFRARATFCLLILGLCVGIVSPLRAQSIASDAATLMPDRPIPYPVTPPPPFHQAVENGTRTTTGQPGPKYWTNTADYTIDATLSPASKTLRGTMQVQYHNNSPDTLQQVAFHLRQNLHTRGTVRNRTVQITGGMPVSEVSCNGQSLVEYGSLSRRNVGYTIRGTRLFVALPKPIAPGGSATFSMNWSFEIPQSGAPRMGQDGEVFFLGYWYPQLAVYDDIDGWTAEPYQGDGEFYMDYGTYDVSITLPEGWLVGATGTLQNPEEVLSEQTRRRLRQATQTHDITPIVAEDERSAGASTTHGTNGTLTWHFSAEQGRDFAFGASDHYVWDATTAKTGDQENGSALIHTFYRPDASGWDRSAEFAQYSIEHLSDMIMPYPYPHMTAIEGVIGGGMEYPMVTLIGGHRTYRSLFGVTYHEISHMWFPMVVGQNEKHYTWMDEGTTTFNTAEGESDFFDTDAWPQTQRYYFSLAGTGYEVPPMRHADRYPYGSSARGIASYTKPAVALNALRHLVGDEQFFTAYREYARRWAFKHPQPYDFFNTFEDVLGQDLDWFWTALFYETWTLDQAIADVQSTSDAVMITVRDEGRVPMPVPLRVTYTDGSTVERMIPVDAWLKGQRETTVKVEPGAVQRVVIDPKGFLPDTDRSDNTWSSESASVQE